MEDKLSYIVWVGGSGYGFHTDVEEHYNRHKPQQMSGVLGHFRKVMMVRLWHSCAIVCVCVCVPVHLFWTLKLSVQDLHIKSFDKARKLLSV